MIFYVYKNSGFCSGVRHVVDTVKSLAEKGKVFCFGNPVHNDYVVSNLKSCGAVVVDSPEQIPEGSTVVVRAHGVSPSVFDEFRKRNLNVVDCTCPYVSRIQKTAARYHKLGYKVVLVGNAAHPEILGINGWCDGQAVLWDGESPLDVSNNEKTLVLFQTTYNSEKIEKTLQNLSFDRLKTLEIFKTICYTTTDRQNFAHLVSDIADLCVVIGDKSSSNTGKLHEIAVRSGKDVMWVDGPNVPDVDLSKYSKVGLISGASTPEELVKGVLKRMSETAKEAVEIKEVSASENVSNNARELLDAAIANMPGKPRAGQRVKGLVVHIDDEGVYVRLSNWKQDAIIPNDLLTMEEDYQAAKDAIKIGDEMECYVNSSENGKITLSRKAVEERLKDDEIVGDIKKGAQFEVEIKRTGKDCLIGRVGSYTVIVHASQIKLGFVKNLEPYVGKTLKLVSSEGKVDDEKKLIFASQKAILLAEKQQKEDEFWNNIEVNEIVEGKVLRFAPFGAFVDVRGFDCLAHSSDLSWERINGPEEVLEIGKTYEFLVLSLDREKNRVSLSYKQLQPKPWDAAAEKFAVGSIVKGKVARIMPFGAFIELDKHIDGLLHISNVSWEWLDDINKALKVGDEIEVEVLGFDAETKHITLSRKAVLPKPEDVPAHAEDAE